MFEFSPEGERQLIASVMDSRLPGKPNFIYGLTDPRTGEIRYIGKSVRPMSRFRDHLNDHSNCHRVHWIQSLLSVGLEPGLVILECYQGAWPWQEGERAMIAKLLASGARLTNGTSGGDGVPDLCVESRDRIRSAWVGRKHTKETRAKLRAARAERVTSDETRKRISAAHKGRKILWLDKIAEKNRKISHDDLASIQRRIREGEMVKDLAAEFGVHRTTMSKIKSGTYETLGQATA